MTVKQSLQGKVDWHFCFHGFAISGDLVVFVCFNLFFLLFWALVYILINITNFLQNEHFVYILTVEKLCPYFGKIKFVCKLMHFEHDDVENRAT